MRAYRNFDIELANHRSEGDREYLTARVVSSPIARRRPSQAEEVAFPERLRRLIPELESRRLNAEGMISLGEALGELLLPVSAKSLFKQSLARLRRDEGLRVRIMTDTPELAELPWEFAYVASADTPSGRKDESGFLALNLRLSLVRLEYLDQPTPGKHGQRDGSLRIGAVLADVVDPALARLELDKEELALRQSIDGLAGVEISVVRPGTLKQFEDLLSSRSIQIFHFAGHGDFVTEMGEEPGVIEGRGSLIFAGDENRPVPLDAARLALNLNNRGVQLAVLGACEAATRDSVSYWSGVAPALIRHGVPVVVGMQYTVRDANAIAFGTRFYRALANGESVDAAVCEGRLGILNRGGAGERDWGTPALYLQTDHPVLFPEPVRPVRNNLVLAVASIALLSGWFYLHIYPSVADSASRVFGNIGIGAGALAGLVAFWQLVGAILTQGSRRRATESLIPQMLRHRLARWFLWPLFIVAFLLSATTTSIYFDLDSEDVDALELDLLVGEDLIWNPLPKLSVSRTDNRLRAGGPVFLQLPPSELQLRVATPADWQVNAASRLVQPRPWRSARIRASTELSRLELRPLRVAAMWNLVEWLPRPGADASTTRYSLKIGIGDGPLTELEGDLRQGLVYLGGTEANLENFYGRESAADREVELKKCDFMNNFESMIGYWRPEDASYQRFYSTAPIEAGQVLTIQVDKIENGIEMGKIFSGTVSPESLQVGRISTVCIFKQVQQ